MSNCHCPLDLESLSQLCANCEAEYLKYLDERENDSREPEESYQPEPTADAVLPATFAALTAWLENSDIVAELIARVITLETQMRTQRAALEIQRERINRSKEFMSSIFGEKEAAA